MNEKAFEKVERDLNLATGEIKIMGAKGTGTSRPLSIIRLAGGRIILFRAKLSFVPSSEFLQYSA